MLTQIQMIIEVVLSFFLLLGIIYSFYLGRVLSNLRRDRTSLLELVAKLEAVYEARKMGLKSFALLVKSAGALSAR
ncbi:hypothetical protein [Komagataeibacter kakiaceti]|uniref:hypothetical protein n=1 Tax=Komagataeibacter kakiaceti TaxID=943261 RepID=UPI000684A9B6|nr:hypothetical protein [Komagataeibacter kakiaceti]